MKTWIHLFATLALCGAADNVVLADEPDDAVLPMAGSILLQTSEAPLADEPGDAAATRIEFRWLEDKPIDGVTFAEGIQTTCGPELSYPHATPVLTQVDVARAEFQEVEFTNGLPSPQYMVNLHLTEEAKQKLVESCPTQPGQLAVFVNDDYLGTRYLWDADVEDFVPSAGFTMSRSYALRIVSAVDEARAEEEAAQ